MFKILDARQLASDVKWFRIDAPLVAKNRQPGQFVIIRLSETGERIPLTIAHSDAQQGFIELIVKAIGKTTIELCKKEKGGTISDVMGPQVTLVSSADETAFAVMDRLGALGLLREPDRVGRHRFVSSGDVELFRELGAQLLGPELDHTESWNPSGS